MRKLAPLGLSIIIVLCLVSLDSDSLPDYKAYQFMFDSVRESILSYNTDENFLSRASSTEAFIGLISLVTPLFGEYSSFRFAIIVLSGCLSWFLLQRQIAVYISYGPTALAANFVYAFILVAPLFEFYLVRLRAGFSILFFLLARFLIQELIAKRANIISIRSALILCLSVFIGLASLVFHASTFLTLIFFIVLPYLFCRLAPHSLLSIPLSTSFFVVVSSLFLIYISTISEARGAHLESPLNFYRMVAVFIVPMCAIVVLCLCGPAAIRLVLAPGSPKYSGFIHLYASLCVPAVILYYTGFFALSGEALVRVVTLSSVPALLTLSETPLLSARSFLPLYLVSCNSAFFLFTVFNTAS